MEKYLARIGQKGWGWNGSPSVCQPSTCAIGRGDWQGQISSEALYRLTAVAQRFPAVQPLAALSIALDAASAAFDEPLACFFDACKILFFAGQPRKKRNTAERIVVADCTIWSCQTASNFSRGVNLAIIGSYCSTQPPQRCERSHSLAAFALAKNSSRASVVTALYSRCRGLTDANYGIVGIVVVCRSASSQKPASAVANRIEVLNIGLASRGAATAALVVRGLHPSASRLLTARNFLLCSI